MTKQLVFVYGSLRQGGPGAMSIRFPAATFVAGAEVRGRLYDMGEYPGLLLDDSSSVVIGEVYEVDDDTLTKLDSFEATSDYLRKQVETYLGNEKRTCWIYVPGYESEFYSRYGLITSGDWVEYASTKSDKSRESLSDES